MNLSLLSPTEVNHFQENGFLILDNFFSIDICELLIHRAHFLIDEFNSSQIKTIFSTKDQRYTQEKYFLESGDKIHFFFEDAAFDNQGGLKFDKTLCINKIGHAIHSLDPVFYSVSHSHKIAALVHDLNITNPLLIQSMYIFKQPYIGGEVTCHQDSTYLFVKDQPILGMWFALQSATLENGCLWAIPGGHKTPLKSRLKRNKTNGTFLEMYDDTPWQLDKMIPLPVPQGALIVLHGLLPHMSKQNTSPHSRHAYTLHAMSGDCEYPKDNWLQRPAHFPFAGFL